MKTQHLTLFSCLALPLKSTTQSTFTLRWVPSNIKLVRGVNGGVNGDILHTNTLRCPYTRLYPMTSTPGSWDRGAKPLSNTPDHLCQSAFKFHLLQSDIPSQPPQYDLTGSHLMQFITVRGIACL